VRDAFPDAERGARVVVACIGNRFRGDDAAALEVARLLRGRLPGDVEILETEGEPTRLVDVFSGADVAILVDAASSGAGQGTIHRIDLGEQELPRTLFRASTHHFTLADTVSLAQRLGRLPKRTVVYAIEGVRFEAGEGLCPAVAAAAERTAELIRAEVAGYAA
jgi:hydrogenase maturation protease